MTKTSYYVPNRSHMGPLNMRGAGEGCGPSPIDCSDERASFQEISGPSRSSRLGTALGSSVGSGEAAVGWGSESCGGRRGRTMASISTFPTVSSSSSGCLALLLSFDHGGQRREPPQLRWALEDMLSFGSPLEVMNMKARGGQTGGDVLAAPPRSRVSERDGPPGRASARLGQSLPWGMDRTFHLSTGKAMGPEQGNTPSSAALHPSCFSPSPGRADASVGLGPASRHVHVTCPAHGDPRPHTRVPLENILCLSTPEGLTLGLGAAGLFPASLCFVSLLSSLSVELYSQTKRGSK